MNQESLTLYKLIVLYILNKIQVPLTIAQLADLILEKEYTDFLTLQTIIYELDKNELINARTEHNRTHLHITAEGHSTLSYFENRISDTIKEEILEYLQEHEMEIREESSVQSTYYKAVSGEFEAELTIMDRDINLLTVRLSVPTEELAQSICENWRKKNSQIYQYLTAELF